MSIRIIITAVIIKWKMRRVAKDIEKSDTLSIADENVKCCISAESGSTVF